MTDNISEECIVCFETLFKRLSCNHPVHLSCVQQSADAMQDIRRSLGYPPITECACPVCRKPVNGLVPRQPKRIALTGAEFGLAVSNWRRANDEIKSRSESPDGGFLRGRSFLADPPLDWHIWILLCEKYPQENPDDLRYEAELYADLW